MQLVLILVHFTFRPIIYGLGIESVTQVKQAASRVILEGLCKVVIL